jgi:hypothetical protein
MAISITGTTAVNTTGSALILPLDELLEFGLNASEFSNTAANIQRAIFALLKAIQGQALTGVLGVARGNLGQVLASPNLINNTFSWSFDRLVNLTQNTVGQIPLPTTGSNSGEGGLSLAEYLDGGNVRVVGNNTSVTDSLIIPVSDLSPLGYNPGTGTLDPLGDDRLFYRAFFRYLTSNSQFPVRANGTPSAITARAVTAPALTVLPANALDATNPTTAIPSGDTVAILRQTYTVTMQQTINQATDTVDVNFI